MTLFLTDNAISRDSDGTFIVDVSDYCSDIKPLRGIPTQDLAEQIESALWKMASEGANNALAGY